MDRTRNHTILDEIPKDIISEHINQWKKDFARPRPLPGWSDDWSNFDKFQQWLAPFLLWGESDPLAGTSLISYKLRSEYCLLGQPIPLLYRVDNYSVLFRIGSRLFLLSHGQEGGVDSVFRVNMTLERLQFGDVTDLDIISVLTRVVNCGGRAALYRWVRLHIYHSISKFTKSIGLSNDSDILGRWTQERWDFLHKTWIDYIR